MPDFKERDFSILQGGGRRNNCFIATDDNAAILENNRFKMGGYCFKSPRVFPDKPIPGMKDLKHHRRGGTIEKLQNGNCRVRRYSQSAR